MSSKKKTDGKATKKGPPKVKEPMDGRPASTKPTIAKPTSLPRAESPLVGNAAVAFLKTAKPAKAEKKARATPEERAAARAERASTGENGEPLKTFAIRIEQSLSASFHQAAGPGKASSVMRKLMQDFVTHVNTEKAGK